MRFAVAVVLPPDHQDISGGAFNEVAEALHHGLLALGHDSVLTNRLDLDEQLGDDLPWMTMPEFVDLFRYYPT